jgi:hypothetical protein
VELASRVAPAGRALRDVADLLVLRRHVVLAGLVLAQVGLTIALALSVEHNRWLWYHGGDQIWLATSGWLLDHGDMPWAIVGWGWPLVLAPIIAISGPTFLEAVPLTLALNVLVLGPLATLCVYSIGCRLAGRLAGLWCAALWVAAPYIAIPLFVDRYHERYVEQVLPQALGLTTMADYPSMVLVLVAATLVLRSLTTNVHDALLAGLVAGLAAGIKPANYLFVAGPVVAYLLARRWREGLGFAAGLAPGTLVLALWKWKGLGELPLFSLGEVRSAAGPIVALAGFDRIDTLDWDTWRENMSDLREFFWSARLVQWAPFAGALAVARRSVPAAGLLLTWLAAYVVFKGSAPVASVETGSFWRILMPAFPAFFVLAAAIPLLIPTLERRLGRRLARPPAHPAPRWAVAAAAVVLGLVPLAVVAVARPVRGPELAVTVNEILVPVDGEAVDLQTSRDGIGQRLTWRTPTKLARVFYRVYRTQGPGADTYCFETGATQCKLSMIELQTTRDTSFFDRSPERGVTYRIGVAANWEDDLAQGDVFLLSAPVRAAP